MKRGKDVEFNGIDLPLGEEIGQIGEEWCFGERGYMSEGEERKHKKKIL